MKRQPDDMAPISQEIQDSILAAYLRAGGALTLSVEDAGKLLGVGKTQAYALVSTGDLPSFKIGSSRRVAVHGVVAFIERMTSGGRSAYPRTGE